MTRHSRLSSRAWRRRSSSWSRCCCCCYSSWRSLSWSRWGRCCCCFSSLHLLPDHILSPQLGQGRGVHQPVPGHLNAQLRHRRPWPCQLQTNYWPSFYPRQQFYCPRQVEHPAEQTSGRRESRLESRSNRWHTLTLSALRGFLHRMMMCIPHVCSISVNNPIMPGQGRLLRSTHTKLCTCSRAFI